MKKECKTVRVYHYLPREWHIEEFIGGDISYLTSWRDIKGLSFRTMKQAKEYVSKYYKNEMIYGKNI